MAMNNDRNITAADIAEDYQVILRLVAEAFVLHQVATYRRPVYRHQYGDISLTIGAMEGFIEGDLKGLGRSTSQCLEFYLTLLDREKMKSPKKGMLHVFGRVPTLTPFGINWISMELDQFGDMIQDMGPEAANKLMGVKS
jgi:hypothetical protein